MTTGRPSKYSPAYCNEVVECLAKGHSVTAFAGEIGVSRSTVFKWAAEIPEFSDALKKGQAKAVHFWEDKLIHLAAGGKGNPVAVIFGLKNRAADDWRDKTENTTTIEAGESITTDVDAARAVGFLLARGAKQVQDDTKH